MSQEIGIGDTVFFVPVVGYRWLNKHMDSYEHKKVVALKIIDDHQTISFNGTDFYPSFAFTKVKE